MFVNARGGMGIIKTKDLQTLRIDECRRAHEEIIALRNECVAHNDGYASRAIIGWDHKTGIHFPQRFRKIYWTVEEARKVWAMMCCVEKDILRNIYNTFECLNLEQKKRYQIENGQLEKL